MIKDFLIIGLLVLTFSLVVNLTIQMQKEDVQEKGLLVNQSVLYGQKMLISEIIDSIGIQEYVEIPVGYNQSIVLVKYDGKYCQQVKE